MKVVTAAAALDSGKFTPESVLNGNSGQRVSGVPLANFGGSDFGPISLTGALTNSVNTVWGQVGEQLGKERMIDYMERFGFGQDPPLDYPEEQMTPSGVFDRGAPPQRQRLDRHRPRGDRPGAAAGHARCRWPWWPRRWATRGA